MNKTPQDYANEIMSYTGTDSTMLKIKEALPRIQQAVLDIYYLDYEDNSGKYRLWRCNIADPNGDLIWQEKYEPKPKPLTNQS